MLNCRHEFWSYTKKPIEKIRDEICDSLNLSFDIIEIRLNWFMFFYNDDDIDESIFDLILRHEKYGDIKDRKFLVQCSLVINKESDLLDLECLGNLISKASEKKVFYGITENVEMSNIPVKNVDVLKIFEYISCE